MIKKIENIKLYKIFNKLLFIKIYYQNHIIKVIVEK